MSPDIQRKYLAINTLIVYNELHALTMEIFINTGGCNEEKREQNRASGRTG